MLSLLMQEATSAPFFWGNMGAAVAMILASASPFSWRCRALPCLSPRRRRGRIGRAWPASYAPQAPLGRHGRSGVGGEPQQHAPRPARIHGGGAGGCPPAS
eukprot:COSAG04_NODE_2029_length_4968_cov_14.878004_8_plen_101_part_00